jgi:hypothetical protein
MLFTRAVTRVGLKLFHRHVTAYDIAEAVLDHRDNLAANSALIEFHNCTSLSFAFVIPETISG